MNSATKLLRGHSGTWVKVKGPVKGSYVESLGFRVSGAGGLYGNQSGA